MTDGGVIHLDGSKGEGGGQILRSALGLSAATGRAFSIRGIRAGRRKPGLLRQHLTAVRAAAEVCGADVEGAALGSTELVFRPGRVSPGAFTWDIGSAGSTTLVLQTVLPALLVAADGPSTVRITGGTHNPMAPTVIFLERSFAPWIERMGAGLEIVCERPGFAPVGGGILSATITPPAGGRLSEIHIGPRGETVDRSVRAVVAGIPGEIARRELEAFAKRSGWPADVGRIESVSGGPGNVLSAAMTVETTGGTHTEVFTGFGERGVAAERVARGVADRVRAYGASTATIGDFLADQLLLPMALAGAGSFRTMSPSSHTRTNIETIRAFVDVPIRVVGDGDEGGGGRERMIAFGDAPG